MRINGVSGYTLQVGCKMKEKEKFSNELDEVVENIPREERVVTRANFNGRCGEGTELMRR